jgi:signal transduction histidine kinase
VDVIDTRFIEGCRTCVPGQLNNPARLRLLGDSGLLTGIHPQLDRLTDLTQELLKVPVVLVSLVDADRQVFPSQVGLPEPWCSMGQTPLSHSFCQHVVTSGKPLIVEDARQDSRVCDNLAIQDLGVISYAGFPIISQSQVLGSFCAIRPQPTSWSELELRLLRQFSDAVSDQVELQLDFALIKRVQEGLEDSNSQLEQFAHILSHDLKGPLRGIKGSLQLLSHVLDPLEEEPAEFLHHALTSADRMSGLIDALREYSAAFEGPRERTWVDLDVLVDGVERDLRELLADADASVVRDSPLGKVWGIAPFLGQVFQNLIANAIKFQPPGQQPRVNVGRRENGHFYVQDNGIGIQAKNLDKIFLVYARLHSKDEFEGSGMGLAICARAVAQHSGKIWVESEPGQGATFVFSLPDRPAHPSIDS